MFDPKTAQEMAKQFVDSLPGNFKILNQEMQSQLKQFLQQWLSKMSLVTREEFDIQTQVLNKTRLKLTQMEATLQKLTENPTIVTPHSNKPEESS